MDLVLVGIYSDFKIKYSLLSKYNTLVPGLKNTELPPVGLLPEKPS